MKTLVTFLAICFLFTLASCDYTPQQVQEINKQRADEREFVGSLPDVGDVYRTWFVTPGGHNHAVYYVKGNPVITTNYTETSGKTTYNRTAVFINGFI